MVPKQYSGYRIAVQLDPVDTIVYTALAYEAAELVENYRVPIDHRVACSYRVELGPKGQLFRKNNGWDDFHMVSQDLAGSGGYGLVVTADIADFYNQIGHHRIRNALESAGVGTARAKNIEHLLLNFTRGQSQGIPVGPAASVVFSEACLSDVDDFLLRKGYAHTRYIDDFRIFCKDRQEANRALHDLTEYLYTAHRLTLQTHKTHMFDVSEFVEKELLDPEELEEKLKEEKLDAIAEAFSDYSESDEDDDLDVEQVIRDNLVELFEASLEHQPLHLGLAKYLLRRAAVLRTGVLRELVLENIEKLMPVLREASHYIIKTTKKEYARDIGERFIKACKETDYFFLAFVQSWVLEVLLNKMGDEMGDEIAELCEACRPNLGSRPYALLAKKKGYIDWVREQKETWQNNNPWDKRAIIWASQALSRDEMNYWLQRVQNAGDILDRAVAESTLHLANN